MHLDRVLNQKRQDRRRLAALSFEKKIAVLLNMQKMARELALASGRKIKGCVWGKREH